jgi:hypothetical protein
MFPSSAAVVYCRKFVKSICSRYWFIQFYTEEPGNETPHKKDGPYHVRKALDIVKEQYHMLSCLSKVSQATLKSRKFKDSVAKVKAVGDNGQPVQSCDSIQRSLVYHLTQADQACVKLANVEANMENGYDLTDNSRQLHWMSKRGSSSGGRADP